MLSKFHNKRHKHTYNKSCCSSSYLYSIKILLLPVTPSSAAISLRIAAFIPASLYDLRFDSYKIGLMRTDSINFSCSILLLWIFITMLRCHWLFSTRKTALKSVAVWQRNATCRTKRARMHASMYGAVHSVNGAVKINVLNYNVAVRQRTAM